MIASGKRPLRRRRPVWGRAGLRFASPRSSRRSGTAAVELALCLPVLLTLALGTIEVCNVMFVRTRMLSAAYEACRLATRPTTASTPAATSTQVTTYCNTLLTQLGIQGATVTVSPSSLASIVPQTQVSVSVSAPLSQNTATSFVIAKTMTIYAKATLISE